MGPRYEGCRLVIFGLVASKVLKKKPEVHVAMNCVNFQVWLPMENGIPYVLKAILDLYQYLKSGQWFDQSMQN